MPGYNRTGPWGEGAMTGRGMGRCGGAPRRQRFFTDKTDAEALNQVESALEDELQAVREQKAALKGQK